MQGKVRTRISSLLLSVIMLLSLLPVTAIAEEGPVTSKTPDTVEVVVSEDTPETGYVAQIDTTPYTTLQAAVDAVPDNTETTITLIANVDGGTLAPSGTVETVATISADQNIVLDLAGYTISAELDTNGSNYAKAHVILNNGTLTITDSSEGHTGAIVNTKTDSNACTRTVKNNGTLTINGGTIRGTVALLNLGTCLIDGENVVIKSDASFGAGGWDNSASAIEHRCDAGNGTLTIKNATVSSVSRAAIFCDGDTNFYVEGGTFTGNTAYGAVNGSTADRMAVITGGSFSSDPTDLIDQTAYVVADGPDGYFEVVELGTSSDVTASTEAELLAQLNAASYAVPLDITLTGNVTLTSSVELLSGSTLTIAEGASLTVAENVVLTQSGLITNDGTLTVNGFLTNPLNLTNHGTITGLDFEAKDYEVKTAMDLQWLTYLVEYATPWNVTLANDITIPEGVEFQMIGAGNNGFYGNSNTDRRTFDGQNHTISGLKIRNTSTQTGMFTSLKYATIKNFTLNADIETNTAYTGGVTGYAVSGVTFSNVVVKGSVRALSASYGCGAIAAAVGNKDGSNDVVEFINCHNEASLGSVYGMNIGGIFGTASGSGDDVGVYNCSNSGAITASTSGGRGYVFGYGYLNQASTLEIIGFTNSGTVNGAEGSISSAAGSNFIYKIEQADSQYIAVKNEDGTWEAKNKSEYAAMVAGIPYATLSAAIDAAQDGDTVTLLTKYEGETVTVSKTIAVDLNDTQTESSKFTAGMNYQMTTDGTKLVFSLKNLTVTFNSNGGSAVASQTVTYNTAATEPPAPTRSGYTFDGWYSDEALTSAYNFSTPVTSDITLYAKWTYVGSGSTGGGSSSSGSSSGNKTETTTNPDGSTTTTVTKPDGSTTETTKQPNGSTTTVATDKDGNVETTVKLPSSVVSEAAEKGEAVVLPMDSVKVSSDSDDASPITVDLPSNTSAKVEIPVADVTAGTVAILVKADGTEQVIKTTLTTENGVAVTLADGDTVKIVDNSKDFDDVEEDYWGSSYIDFATSRELFSGTSESTFSPETIMTRGMIVTVLAAYDGADTSAAAGEVWYTAGQKWAMLNGISDGTNMNGSLNREQLAVMLWSYAGKPAPTGNLSSYVDADSTSDWAADALTWAVENGLISGMDDGTLNPQGQATRAQVATIMTQFVALTA